MFNRTYVTMKKMILSAIMAMTFVCFTTNVNAQSENTEKPQSECCKKKATEAKDCCKKAASETKGCCKKDAAEVKACCKKDGAGKAKNCKKCPEAKASCADKSGKDCANKHKCKKNDKK